MKQDLQLKLQAWLDGELGESEVRRVAQAASDEAEARRVVAELRAVKSAFAGAEMARAVPDSREFYWSKIQRQIQLEARQAEAAAPASPGWLRAWRRLLVPLAGVSVAAGAVLLSVKHAPQPTAAPALAVANYDDVTATSDAMDTMTFHDQSTGLTVVWLQDRPATQTAPATSAQDDDDSMDME